MHIQGLKKVIGLSLVGIDPIMTWQAESFAKLRQLRYLLLDKCLVNGNFSGWSQELRWLQWRYFPHAVLPWNLKSPNLVVLDLANSPNLTCVWAKDFDNEVGTIYHIK